MVGASMKGDEDVLLTLFILFFSMSFLAIGGASAALPEMNRYFVDVRQWMTNRQFLELYAIAQASPGPNVMVVALLGQYVAGAAGALVAIIAMCGPTCILAYGVSRVFDRFRYAKWRVVVQAGLVPVTIGLVAAGSLVIARAADHDVTTLVITATTFAISYWTRITPLLCLGVAAAIGFAGLL
jgi:chromate transporter